MKTFSKKLLATVFALILVVTVLASCQKTVKFDLTEDYTIIVDDYFAEDESVVAATALLCEAIESTYGFTPEVKTDAECETPTGSEILVGPTNREASTNEYWLLGINDYSYVIESESQVVVCGGSPAMTLEAAKAFCLDVLHYGEGATEATDAKNLLTVGNYYVFTAEYSYEELMLCGVAAENIKIAYSNEEHLPYAYQIANKLSSYSGVNVPIVKYSELGEGDKNVICLGAEDKTGVPSLLEGHVGYLITTESEGGLLIGLQASDMSYFEKAVERWFYNLAEEDYEGAMDLTYLECDVYLFNTDENLPEWNLISETVTEFCDGGTYYRQIYTDRDGLPYRAYTIVLEAGKFTYHMGSSNDGYDYTVDKAGRQTVREHAEAAIANGLNVIAGINADFFDINGDYHPTGLTIKNGQLISKGAKRAWVGFTEDGQFVYGLNGQTDDLTGVYTAVGGRNLLVKDGLPGDFEANLEMHTDFGYTSHPRTIGGVRKDGTVIFSVIDGRQPKVSNGAPLARCANFMISFGADVAINLDGGGSSCLIIHTGERFATKNLPSDGGLRKVYNSILVVPKAEK